MDIEKININELLNRYINFVENISYKYNYDSNIKHVLYIIVPSFVLKYNIRNERIILKLFEETKIIINSKEDDYAVASFNRSFIKTNNNYEINKSILLNLFNKVSLIELVDSLVHEFNHGINSINNETYIDDNYIYLRSGVIYTKYNKETLSIIDNKEKYIILEEVLNTKETEEIINIILSLNKYLDEIDNNEICNMLHALKIEIGDTYISNSYILQSLMAKELTKNKTFSSTLNSLRFSGNINNIEDWFDNITGLKNSYNDLCNKLTDVADLEKKYLKEKYFRKRILNKIKAKFNYISFIIETFNNNCIYK